MTYSEVTKTSYISRIWNSFKWVLFGIILIVASIVLLWWNEWRTIDVATWLNETQKITVDGKTGSIDQSLENQIVYNSWNANTLETLTDSDFWIEINGIKLIKTVEMYQWKENIKENRKDNLWGSQTTTKEYTYNKIWSSKKLPSESYKKLWHTNPVDWKYTSNTLQAKDVRIWVLRLWNEFINKLNNKEPIKLTQENLEGFKKISRNDSLKIQNNYIYYWKNLLNNPSIGDIRVSFAKVKPADITVIWLQSWDNLNSYITSHDTQVALLEYWIRTKQQMFQIAQEDNKVLAWVFRWIWLLLMFIGFNLLFGVLVALSKVIPMLWNVLGFWVSIIAFILTLIVWLWIIIIAWLFVRPFLSIGLIILVVWIIWFIVKKKREKLIQGKLAHNSEVHKNTVKEHTLLETKDQVKKDII